MKIIFAIICGLAVALVGLLISPVPLSPADFSKNKLESKNAEKPIKSVLGDRISADSPVQKNSEIPAPAPSSSVPAQPSSSDTGQPNENMPSLAQIENCQKAAYYTNLASQNYAQYRLLSQKNDALSAGQAQMYLFEYQKSLEDAAEYRQKCGD